MNDRKKKAKKHLDDIKIKKENLKEPESGTISEKNDANHDEVMEEVISKKESKKHINYKKELEALNEKYLRLLAEYDNFRKRSAREIENIFKTATVNLIKEVLPILDNLDLATEHKDNKTTLEEYVKGITLIEDQLRDILARSGLEHIEVVGKPFDPNLHDAVMQIESDEYESGIVTSETQKGYMFSSTVIRHPKVIVSK